VFLAAVAGGVAAYFVYRARFARDRMPAYEEPSLDPERFAARIDRMEGAAFQKIAVESDLLSPEPSVPPGSPEERAAQGWKVVSLADRFIFGTLFYLPEAKGPGEKHSLQLVTAGNWIVLMDGEGEFLFEDARVGRQQGEKGVDVQTGVWRVRRGLLRVKPHDYDPAEHWLEVRAPMATVTVIKGEIGLRVFGPDKGQVWLMSGRAIVEPVRGDRHELKLRAMEYI